MADPYFDGVQGRQPLLWAIAARSQLDRWEPLVAEHLAATIAKTKMPADHIWQGEAEHHLAVVAFDHMLEALKLREATIQLPDIVVREVAEVRDLAEHWVDNMPLFNQRPRRREPKYRSGKSYASRNPTKTPYCWWAWESSRGAMLTPNVAASDAREAIRNVEQVILAEEPRLARFVPPEVASPWRRDEKGHSLPPTR